MSIQQSINQALSLWSLVSPKAEERKIEKRIAAETASREAEHKAELQTLKEKFDVAATRAEQLPIGADKEKKISATARAEGIAARQKTVEAGEAYFAAMTAADTTPDDIASLSDRLLTMREEIKSGEKIQSERAAQKAKRHADAEAAARQQQEIEQRRQAFWKDITQGVYLRNPDYNEKKETK